MREPDIEDREIARDRHGEEVGINQIYISETKYSNLYYTTLSCISESSTMAKLASDLTLMFGCKLEIKTTAVATEFMATVTYIIVG